MEHVEDLAWSPETPMDERTLFAAYRGMKPADRWVIRELPTGEDQRYYVQDRHLGYCTDPMSFARAVTEAKDRNRSEELARDGST